MMTNSGRATVTLPSDTEIEITRVFAAPARLVYEAWTTPEHIRQWYGRRGDELVVCEMDSRVGGAWRFVLRGPDGDEHGFHGVVLELVPNERIVSTEVYEGFPDAEAVNTLTLEKKDGETTLTVVVRHATQQHRDGHIASGMEGGMQQTLDRLEELLATLV
jgi:uncharacterized protein YndB with AHSA1/START domain